MGDTVHCHGVPTMDSGAHLEKFHPDAHYTYMKFRFLRVYVSFFRKNSYFLQVRNFFPLPYLFPTLPRRPCL